jgi:sugar lactone lactonase YvrE
MSIAFYLTLPFILLNFYSLKMNKLLVANSCNNILGEGPIWHAERESIFWIDIEGKKLFELNEKTNQLNTWALAHRIGTVAIDTSDNLLLALQGKIVRFHLKTNEFENLLELEENITNNRPNDGKVDPKGRLWQGTMHVDCKENEGSLYCIDKTLKISKKLSDLSISNGMVWTQNQDFFYHIDSPSYQIKKYSYDNETGKIKYDKVAINIPQKYGMPDGMTIDENGNLWIALWGGFAVQCWDPINEILLETIECPAPQITSCTFGGENLDKLYITSARIGLDHKTLEKYPESGSLFVKKLRVKGFKPNKFGCN